MLIAVSHVIFAVQLRYCKCFIKRID